MKHFEQFYSLKTIIRHSSEKKEAVSSPNFPWATRYIIQYSGEIERQSRSALIYVYNMDRSPILVLL